ncbi:MAG TPA: hypothetical protein VKP00_07065 [Gemmatimonadaceae bacterium]|nr:hypothetical protein [Gemmatimonadaceae bacterium]
MMWPAYLLDANKNGLTDGFSSCYSHPFIIITDSEEKRHGSTSQEVSQEVREQDGQQAKRIEEPLSIGQALEQEGTSRQARRRAQEVFNKAARDQESREERGEAARDQEKCEKCEDRGQARRRQT